jgi:hypothetical protein
MGRNIKERIFTPPGMNSSDLSVKNMEQDDDASLAIA